MRFEWSVSEKWLILKNQVLFRMVSKRECLFECGDRKGENEQIVRVCGRFYVI